MALDQGTTSSRAMLFDESGDVVAVDQYEFPQYFPKPGWVEHDAEEIWESQLRAARGALEKAGASGADVAAIGITNQRETALVWDRASGEPIGRAIVWQSRQTAPLCEELRSRGLEEEVRRRTGLVIDAYFSGTKVRFMLDAVAGAYRALSLGDFESARPLLECYVASLTGYQKNVFAPLDAGDRRDVATAWRRSFEAWGYTR